MRTIIGAIVGALAAGVLLIAYNTQQAASRLAELRAAPAESAYLAARPQVASDRGDLAGNTTVRTITPGGPVLVSCGPNQRALVRPTTVNGEAMSQIDCVSEATAPVYFDQYGRPIYPASDVRIVPAYGADRTVTRRAVYATPERRVSRSRRSWTKSAAIIGGSAATGAGIGGIIGGKKGALIGAAIGGGASTIYEARKH